MRHLKHLFIAFALLALGATNDALTANVALGESATVSVNVQLPDCSPLTCGGGGS
ncbi:MAG: hypothetical protein JOZ51_12880 [Chloroflexi bacterium]|nr:hypothetical protein [Chloroflexota bacterium]